MAGEIFREKRVKQRVAECGQWAGGPVVGRRDDAGEIFVNSIGDIMPSPPPAPLPLLAMSRERL
jgi:hypothetical protein